MIRFHFMKLFAGQDTSRVLLVARIPLRQLEKPMPRAAATSNSEPGDFAHPHGALQISIIVPSSMIRPDGMLK